MPPGILVPTDPATLLIKLQQQISTAVGLHIECVQLVARDEQPYHSQAEQYVTIRPGGQRAEAQIVGGGRLDGRCRRHVTIRAWTRAALDEADRDFTWLTDATRGHLAFELAVAGAILLFHPKTSDGGFLCEPIADVTWSRPDKPDKEATEWGKSETEMELVFVANLSPAYDPTDDETF